MQCPNVVLHCDGYALGGLTFSHNILSEMHDHEPPGTSSCVWQSYSCTM